MAKEKWLNLFASWWNATKMHSKSHLKFFLLKWKNLSMDHRGNGIQTDAGEKIQNKHQSECDITIISDNILNKLKVWDIWIVWIFERSPIGREENDAIDACQREEFNLSPDKMFSTLRCMYISPKPMQHITTMAVELRYNRRLPHNFTHTRKARPPAMLVDPKIMATRCSFIGIPYDLITWMMYGRQQIAPENSSNTFNAITRMNGFRCRIRLNSFSLSKTVAAGCGHGIRCLAHASHAFTSLMCVWSFSNSSWTASGWTHPRSHWSERCASLGRLFDSSQFGDSGIFNETKNGSMKISNENWLLAGLKILNKKMDFTKQIAMKIMIGKMLHANDTSRHDK